MPRISQDRCRFCRVKYVNHLGVGPLCQEVQRLRQIIRQDRHDAFEQKIATMKLLAGFRSVDQAAAILRSEWEAETEALLAVDATRLPEARSVRTAAPRKA